MAPTHSLTSMILDENVLKLMSWGHDDPTHDLQAPGLIRYWIQMISLWMIQGHGPLFWDRSARGDAEQINTDRDVRFQSLGPTCSGHGRRDPIRRPSQSYFSFLSVSNDVLGNAQDLITGIADLSTVIKMGRHHGLPLHADSGSPKMAFTIMELCVRVMWAQDSEEERNGWHPSHEGKQWYIESCEDQACSQSPCGVHVMMALRGLL